MPKKMYQDTFDGDVVSWFDLTYSNPYHEPQTILVEDLGETDDFGSYTKLEKTNPSAIAFQLLMELPNNHINYEKVINWLTEALGYNDNTDYNLFEFTAESFGIEMAVTVYENQEIFGFIDGPADSPSRVTLFPDALETVVYHVVEKEEDTPKIYHVYRYSNDLTESDVLSMSKIGENLLQVEDDLYVFVSDLQRYLTSHEHPETIKVVEFGKVGK